MTAATRALRTAAPALGELAGRGLAVRPLAEHLPGRP
jgi:hypothetical protein